MTYTHLLIPTRPLYVPQFEALKRFFVAIESLGIVPEPWDIWILDRDGSSVVDLPGRSIRVPGQKIPVYDLYAADKVLDDLTNYDLRARGEGRPRHVILASDELPDHFDDLTEAVQVAVAWHQFRSASQILTTGFRRSHRSAPVVAPGTSRNLLRPGYTPWPMRPQPASGSASR